MFKHVVNLSTWAVSLKSMAPLMHLKLSLHLIALLDHGLSMHQQEHSLVLVSSIVSGLFFLERHSNLWMLLHFSLLPPTQTCYMNVSHAHQHSIYTLTEILKSVSLLLGRNLAFFHSTLVQLHFCYQPWESRDKKSHCSEFIWNMTIPPTPAATHLLLGSLFWTGVSNSGK